MTAKLWLGARGLGIVGTIALTAGLANVMAPGSAFPSRTTCVTDYDLIMCTIEPWPAALWLAIAGGAAVAIAWSVLTRLRASSPLSDDTR